MRDAASRKIVLFPYGQPTRPEHRDLCARVFLQLDGDLQRVMDGPFPSLDRFVHYVSRIDSIANCADPPIVLLTETSPLQDKVIDARRRLELRVAGLRNATWVLCVDLTVDRAFLRNAREIGSFERGDDGLVWYGPEGESYLVAVTMADAERQSEQSASRRASLNSIPAPSMRPTPPPQSGTRTRTPQFPADVQNALIERSRFAKMGR
jgi:hypothetical protein